MAELQTPVMETTAAPESNGKVKKAKLPSTPQVFDTEDAATAGRQAAIKLGYKPQAVKRHKVVSADGKITKYCLGYGSANAASKVVKEMGLKVISLDATERAPAVATVASVMGGFSKLSEADRALILAEINKTAKKGK